MKVDLTSKILSLTSSPICGGVGPRVVVADAKSMPSSDEEKIPPDSAQHPMKGRQDQQCIEDPGLMVHDTSNRATKRAKSSASGSALASHDFLQDTDEHISSIARLPSKEDAPPQLVGQFFSNYKLTDFPGERGTDAPASMPFDTDDESKPPALPDPRESATFRSLQQQQQQNFMQQLQWHNHPDELQQQLQLQLQHPQLQQQMEQQQNQHHQQLQQQFEHRQQQEQQRQGAQRQQQGQRQQHQQHLPDLLGNQLDFADLIGWQQNSMGASSSDTSRQQQFHGVGGDGLSRGMLFPDAPAAPSLSQFGTAGFLDNFSLLSGSNNPFQSGYGGNSIHGQGHATNAPVDMSNTMSSLAQAMAAVTDTRFSGASDTHQSQAGQFQMAFPSTVGSITSGHQTLSAAAAAMPPLTSQETSSLLQAFTHRLTHPPARPSCSDSNIAWSQMGAHGSQRAAIPALPPFEEEVTPHFSLRTFVPFSVDEDHNWLSELQCFIRAEILELFRVKEFGIKARNKGKTLSVNQVGIRCRFCAHLEQGERAKRSSAFPSKISKIYNSFTMMLREHFDQCSEIPAPHRSTFDQLKSMNSQGASDAKKYWEHAAKKLGMVDVDQRGIHILSASQAEAATMPPFGYDPAFREPPVGHPLVGPDDRQLVSGYLYGVMEQVYRVSLSELERSGHRKTLKAGTPGFGCKYCYEANRWGQCRMFPARKRTIHSKVPDLYDHLKRCPLCPQYVKETLARLHEEAMRSENAVSTRTQEKQFYERIWSRLGHEGESD